MSDVPPHGGFPPPGDPNQPPPAGGSVPPPGPPPGGSYPPPAGQPRGGQFDYNRAQAQVKAADPLDLALVVIGVVSLLLSFFHFYKATVTLNGDTASTLGVAGSARVTVEWNAWHGFFGWFGIILMLAGAVVAALKVLNLAPEVPFTKVLAGLFGAAFLCQILALFIVPIGDTGDAESFGIHIDKGHAWSFWLVLILSLAAAGIALYKLRLEQARAPR